MAADCNPEWHSLPALIWEYCLVLSQKVDVHLVTLSINRANIEAVRPQSITVDYVDSEIVSGPIFRLTQMLVGESNKAMTLQVAMRYPSQLFFEYQVWKKYRDRLHTGSFDVLHRASPMSPVLPSYLSQKSPIPFVIGPLLGGLSWPQGFAKEMRREGEWMNYVRRLHKYLPFYKSTYRCADAVLAGYPHTVADLPVTGRDNVVEFSEGGIHTEDYPFLPKTQNDVKTVLFVGRMVPFKQPQMLIECFAESVYLRRHKLVMIGDGPEIPRLQDLILEHRLSDVVTLLGEAPMSQVVEAMRQADVFGFPSIREQGGGVITIASLCETPSVVIDYGGPKYRVPDDCGIRVPLGSRAEVKSRFKAALERLIANDTQARSMGQAARAFASKYYDWQHKADKTIEVYDWINNESAIKPNFWRSNRGPGEV